MASEPEETYRTLAGVMGPVDVERPAWAQQYAVGDAIHFEAPPDGDVRSAAVVGFSSQEAYAGRPVILADAELREYFDERARQIVITEPYHVPPAEVSGDGA